MAPMDKEFLYGEKRLSGSPRLGLPKEKDKLYIEKVIWLGLGLILFFDKYRVWISFFNISGVDMFFFINLWFRVHMLFYINLGWVDNIFLINLGLKLIRFFF